MNLWNGFGAKLGCCNWKWLTKSRSFNGIEYHSENDSNSQKIEEKHVINPCEYPSHLNETTFKEYLSWEKTFSVIFTRKKVWAWVTMKSRYIFREKSFLYNGEFSFNVNNNITNILFLKQDKLINFQLVTFSLKSIWYIFKTRNNNFNYAGYLKSLRECINHTVFYAVVARSGDYSVLHVYIKLVRSKLLIYNARQINTLFFVNHIFQFIYDCELKENVGLQCNRDLFQKNISK